jgi:hypothetical protein
MGFGTSKAEGAARRTAGAIGRALPIYWQGQAELAFQVLNQAFEFDYWLSAARLSPQSLIGRA